MCKSILRINLTIIAILLGVIGLATLSLRVSLFDSSTYKEPIEKNNLYSLVTDLTSNDVFSTDAIEGNALINKQDQQEISKLFALAVIGNVDIESILKTTVEQNLDNIAFWANTDSELKIYFPKQKLQESLGEENLVNMVYEGLNSILKFDTLPTCTPEQLTSIETNSQVDVFNLECLPAEFKETIDKEISNSVESLGFSNIIEEFLEDQGLEYLQEETPVELVIENTIAEQDQQTLLDSLDTAHRILMISKIIPWILICLSIFFALITVFLGKKDFKQFFKNFAKITFITGLITTTINILLLYTVKSLVETRIPWEKTPWANAGFDFGINPSDVTQTFQEIIIGIADNIFRTPITIGIVLVSISFIIYLSLRLIDYIGGVKEITPENVKETIDQNNNSDTNYQEK